MVAAWAQPASDTPHAGTLFSPAQSPNRRECVPEPDPAAARRVSGAAPHAGMEQTAAPKMPLASFVRGTSVLDGSPAGLRRVQQTDGPARDVPPRID